MNKRRRQLTLFVDQKNSLPIERIRALFNPRQQELIRSHVTLCRDEEAGNMEILLQNLKKLNPPSLVLTFGKPIRFSNNEGVLMPVTDGIYRFQDLRELILTNAVDCIKSLTPHITLLHPRNATCTNQIFEQIQQMELPAIITFNKISLIEQEENRPWSTLAEFEFA